LASLTFPDINNLILGESNPKNSFDHCTKSLFKLRFGNISQIMSQMDISCPLTHAKDIHSKL